jgi:hypothetical protein
MLSPSDLQA